MLCILGDVQHVNPLQKGKETCLRHKIWALKCRFLLYRVCFLPIDCAIWAQPPCDYNPCDEVHFSNEGAKVVIKLEILVWF